MQNKRTLVSFIELPALVSTLCLTIIVRIWACCSLGWLITPDIYLYRWIYLAGAWLPAWLRPALCAGSYWGTWLGSTPGSPPCCMHHPGVRRDPPSKVRPQCRFQPFLFKQWLLTPQKRVIRSILICSVFLSSNFLPSLNNEMKREISYMITKAFTR